MIFFYRDTYQDRKVSLDVTSLAFRFGVGFFETLLYNGESICHLDSHIARMTGSLKAYDIDYATVDFGDVISEVIRLNDLSTETARVNICYLIEDESSPATPLIVAQPYEVEPDRTYSLKISPYRHVSHLCLHKTTNYMHYYLARRDAWKHGFDDALLTDENDHALETSTASLLFSDGKSFIAPESNGILPGIAIDIARRVIGVSERPVPIESLDDFRYVYVLNSLIGMKPVALIDDTAFPIDTSTSNEITKHILLL